MQEDELKKWRTAGKNAAIVLNYAKRITKPEISLLEIAQKVELKIQELKVKCAFPINLSINEIAAHSTPSFNDEETANGLLKIDVGISVDGYIGDTALSIDLTPEHKYKELIKASEEALKEAIKNVKENEEIKNIGKAIQKAISSFGFAPVRNLSGHEIKQYNLHAGLTIPNYDNGSSLRLKKDMIIAIEPFATTGEGIIQDGRQSGIYKFIEKRNVRDSESRKILDFIYNEYNELPFSARWLINKFGSRALISLKMLEQANALHHYRQLVEKTKMPVSQAEHTVLVTEKGCEILTKED